MEPYIEFIGALQNSGFGLVKVLIPEALFGLQVLGSPAKEVKSRVDELLVKLIGE